jgi:hypothetical protein
VQWLGHLLPPVSDLLQGFMCVCTQVSGSVVSNWPLREFCGRVYCDIWYIFLIPQFFETPDDGWSPKVQFVQSLWKSMTLISTTLRKREKIVNTDSSKFPYLMKGNFLGHNINFSLHTTEEKECGVMTILVTCRIIFVSTPAPPNTHTHTHTHTQKIFEQRSLRIITFGHADCYWKQKIIYWSKVDL